MTLHKMEYTDDTDPDPEMVKHRELVRDISKLLVGNNPGVMGGVIVELMAKFIAGHAPPLRAEIFKTTVRAVKGIVPICALELSMQPDGPKDWAGGVEDATPESARPES